MSDPSPRGFYVTTPIYYPSDVPHIGHGYTTVAADVLARWHRQAGDDTWFLTGTDEHGQKMLRTATEHGTTPQAWVDRLVEESWFPVLDTLDVANDDFIRTTQARHEDNVQVFLQRVQDNGHVYAGEYEALYCVGCEEFKPDAEITDGTGEYAGEKVCVIHGRPLELLQERNYFFRLSAFAERLLELYAERPDFVQPASARNEVLQFVSSGLRDLSISRSTFDWGIPVPWDPEHVVYVWFDALLNYVTAVGYGSDEEQFARRWPATHLVGRDILRFHAVIWPAMLMAAGLEVPHQVFAHGWLLVGGEKMSKSRLTGIEPSQIIDVFGSDAFRYYFLSAISFGSDGSFSWEDLSARYHSELANGFGNLASRTVAMVGRYEDGVLPDEGRTGEGQPGEAELVVRQVLADATSAADAAIERLALHEAVAAIWTVVDRLNGYLSEQQPWQLAKDEANRERLRTVLYTTAEGLRGLAVLLSPLMPRSTALLWDALGAPEQLGALVDQPVRDAGRWGQLRAGATVSKLAPLFPRVEES